MSKFNFNIDIFDKDDQLEKSHNNSITLLKDYIDHQYVDLGLPSKTLWYRYNLGVNPINLNTAIDWYGNYYAWGELKPKVDYSWKTYLYCVDAFNNLTKYCTDSVYGNNSFIDGKTELELKDDAANNINPKSKIPTKEDFRELINNTYNNWEHNYNGIENLKGYVFKSKINDNEIFLPAGGFRTANDHKIFGEGYYWTSMINDDDTVGSCYAYRLTFNCNNHINIGNTARCVGFMIRPIINKLMENK